MFLWEEESENHVFHAKDVFITFNFHIAGLLGTQRTSSRLEMGLAQLWAAQRNSPRLELRLVRPLAYRENKSYYLQDPNGQTVETYLRDNQTKFEDYPMVNESDIMISLN